jgi:hypothetical protein
MFKQEVPSIGLSIERATDSVPSDGRFHVVVEVASQERCKRLGTQAPV